MNAHDAAPILATLGVDPSNLGCVMLEVEPLRISEMLGNVTDDFYVHAPEGHKWTWVKGPVAETGAHVTVKYGFLRAAHDPEMAPAVAALMADYQPGVGLRLGDVEIFPEPNVPEPLGYACIVVRIDDEPLRQWNKALSLLPHIDTYPDYKPHLTLAYVRKEYAESAAAVLAQRLPSVVTTTGLSLGDRILA
jgi:hypothetical protein